MSDSLQQLIRQAELHKLQLKINIQFNKNLVLLKESLPKVFALVEKYKAKQVFLKTDKRDSLNLYDSQNNNFLYHESPSDFCRKHIHQFLKNPFFRRFRISKNWIHNEEHLHIAQLNELIDAIQNESPKQSIQQPDFMSTLIISGVGLGYHLLEIVRNADVRNIIIYEKCVDSFFASLHVIDWKPIIEYFNSNGRSISLCIGVEPRKALGMLENSIHKSGLFSQIYTFVYLHTQRKSDLEFVKTYQRELHSFVGGLGYFDDEQIGLAHAYHNIASQHAAFVCPKTHRRKTRLLLVGNGPSLDDHQEYLESTGDHAIIMSCGSALASLIKMGIKPDFQVEMERCLLVNDFINYGSNEADREGITLLCLHSVSPTTMEQFSDCCFAIKPNDAGSKLVHDYFLPQKVQELVFSNPTVTNCGLSFAIAMGFEEIHLIGVDFGMPVEGKHHSDHSFYEEIVEHAAKQDIKIEFFKDEKEVHCKGNFGGQVKTSSLLNMARISMERYLKLVLPAFPNLRCINTNNGAAIEGTEARKLDELPPCPNTDKEDEISDIKASHFYYNNEIEKPEIKKEEILSYFYSIESSLKLKDKINSASELYDEMTRVYGLTSKNKDYVTHHLLRGSLNCFLGAIVEHCMFCSEQEEFQRKTSIGIERFNQFITDVYTKMKVSPFQLDETYNEMLKQMHEKRQRIEDDSAA